MGQFYAVCESLYNVYRPEQTAPMSWGRLGRMEGDAGMALEKELATYKAKLPELKAHVGKYVLIQGDDVIDTFNTYEDALKEGYSKAGLAPFLVKRIEAIENSLFISRFVPKLKAAS